MILYPNINPVAFHLGPIAVYWYGLMYIVAIFGAWGLALLRARKLKNWTPDQISDVIFYCALGVIVGGRVGYMLFYNFWNFVTHPWILFQIWKGGMAFHGGLLGVVCAMWLFSRKAKKTFFEVSDFIAPLVPFGLAAGRIGNFINGELVGRVTNVPWGMVFPNAGPLPRHPSMLYEFFFEGIVLFLILWFYSVKPKPPMAVSGMFALCYGLFRFSVEFFRQPDVQIGFVAFGWLSEGQLLSIPLIIIGAFMLWAAYHFKQKNVSTS